ncbi:IclR family transcriptional regulator C-terminal domain-containing protein, partial [Escherichia coli]|uniref:IclR family transcriptional regulator C-terminal domain-containing protein n=1 Tax=Escherichia coli TaxID=562 RepID=UPI001E63D6EC
DGDGSHGSTSKTPSYTKSVSWHHYLYNRVNYAISLSGDPVVYSGNKIDSYLELLRKCAEQISYGLGYRNENEHLRKGN